MFSTVCGLCCGASRNSKPRPARGERGEKTARLTSASAASARSGDKTFSLGLHEALTSTANASFMSTVSRGDADPASGEVMLKDARKKLKELRAIAKRLEGPVQKYPRSGKSLLKKMQDRYIAVIPETENISAKPDEEPILAEVRAWRDGHLAYWESAAAYKQASPPKGFIVLLKIAKVWVSKDDQRGRSVVVKHKMKNEMQELVLCFPTKRDAEEWSYALWEFISKLRGHTSSVE